MAKKIKRWKGNTYAIKQDIQPLVGTFPPNQSYRVSYHTWKKDDRLDSDSEIDRIRSLFRLENPGITESQLSKMFDDHVETIPNTWWQTRMKFVKYVHTNGNPRMESVDMKTGLHYLFSWADFWAFFDKIEYGEIEGVFTLKKHGCYVTARMILDDDEKQAINDGTW